MRNVDEAALTSHFETEHLPRTQEVLGTVVARPGEVTRYNVARTEVM